GGGRGGAEAPVGGGGRGGGGRRAGRKGGGAPGRGPRGRRPAPPTPTPAATAAPVPLDEPPGMRLVSHGLRAGGQGRSNDGPPNANSWVASLPKTIAPASRSLLTANASAGGTWFCISLEWPVVAIPAVSYRSFNPIGMPCKGPR